MEAKDVTKTELKKVAKEFNEQMGLEPPILLDLKVSALKEKCIEAAGQIDLEQDEYSDEVWEILGALGCDPREDAEEEDAEEEDAEEEDAEEEVDNVVEGEEADEAVEEAMEDTLVEDFKAAKKLVELKEVAGAWECFANLDLDSYAGLQGLKKLRAAMLDCMPDEVREQIEPKPAAKADKPTKTTGGARPASEEVKARNELIESLIGAGKYTRADILDKVAAEYPNVSRSSIQTVLTDSKNVKYTKFANLAVEDENKIMSFKKGK